MRGLTFNYKFFKFILLFTTFFWDRIKFKKKLVHVSSFGDQRMVTPLPGPVFDIYFLKIFFIADLKQVADAQYP